jgi:single-strand DNA-binding protein
MTTDTADGQSNQVFLRGTFAGEAVERTLPSGDELVSFRITVARPPGGRVRVDSIDCASTRATVRRSVTRYQAGDEIELTGSLHRRFWRTPGGWPSSRYEVDVDSLRRARVPE